jgi:glycine cleavage system T protein (aminomethyltransferase)
MNRFEKSLQNPYPVGLAPRPSVVHRPGLLALPKGTERYKVAGGGSLILDITSGDRLTITDLEGGQICEIIAIGGDGRSDPSLLGAKEAREPLGLKATLASDEASGVRVRKALARRGIDLESARAVKLFGSASPAGTKQSFKAERDGLVIIGAPGGKMDVEAQDTATPLEVRIERATLPRANELIALPEPLADPLQEIRVDAKTAKAYVVRAGEYIQVIDVAGRQMTDFQCFSRRKLDQGIENALDGTVTRTMTGRAYPTPGLLSKMFGFDFEPLVEIVQDTVGRHDFFATACTSRYYDDVGYPGHVNCTENFNRALKPYGVAPRKGWEAINYFYNTRVDDQNQLYYDEAWSRPGDYVLMRALTDLVCVSSACPDDINVGNGWNPTDIHVRTYSDKEKFSRAVALRMTPDAEPQMTRETAFHPRFSALTRNYTEYRGFWLPQRFNNDGPVEEYWACRERVAVMDLSPLRKFEVTGPDAEALMQYCVTRDMRKLSPGQVVYTAMCYEHGGMIDDGTVFRLAPNNFRWIGGDDYSGIWLRQQAEKMGFQAWVRSSTDQLHNIAVQGPKSRDLLKEIIWTAPAQPEIGELEWFRFAVGRIGGFEGAPLVVSRTGYTGELGYEIFCHPKDALAVFDAVWEAGRKYGIAPLGLEALDMLRIESGLIFAHYEFTDQTDPFEAGIAFTVPLKTKGDDFIGKAALLERKEHPRHKLVGLDIDANDAVGHGDCVHVGRAQIGVVTSGTRSPLLKKNIALARIDVTHAAIGTAVEIGKLDGHQKRLPARITRFPHFDPEKTRPRS